MATLEMEVKVVESLLSSRQYDEALAKCADLRARHPRSRRVLRLQAHVRYRLGDFSGAIGDLSEIVELEPKEPDGYFTRGRYLLKCGSPGLAIADFTRVVTLSKLWNSEYYVEAALFYRAEALIRCRRFREARQDCMRLRDGTSLWVDSLRSKEQILADCEAGEKSAKR